MLIEVHKALFGYPGRPVVLVEQLQLRAGGCLGIYGPNGVGKTTLIRGMIGQLHPLEGSVNRKTDLRFGYLPQHRALDLNWPMTGLDAASMAISAQRRFGWVGQDLQRVRDAMTTMKVSDLAKRPFAKLSGGQQQRLLLAGAISTNPDILVLDEPTDGLDVRSRQGLLESLRAQNTLGLCTVIISHEMEDLLFLASEIAHLHRGDDPNTPSHIEIIPGNHR